jgi:hypothetical protein
VSGADEVPSHDAGIYPLATGEHGLGGESGDGSRLPSLRGRSNPDRKDCTPCGARDAGVRGGHGEKLDFCVGFCSLWEVRAAADPVRVSSGRKVLVPCATHTYERERESVCVCVCACVRVCVCMRVYK